MKSRETVLVDVMNLKFGDNIIGYNDRIYKFLGIVEKATHYLVKFRSTDPKEQFDEFDIDLSYNWEVKVPVLSLKNLKLIEYIKDTSEKILNDLGDRYGMDSDIVEIWKTRYDDIDLIRFAQSEGFRTNDDSFWDDLAKRVGLEPNSQKGNDFSDCLTCIAFYEEYKGLQIRMNE
jgi:hypothetical protein